MRFLISNDDGVGAPGIVSLAEAMGQLGHVDVVAPQSNCSGYSSALTLDRPIHPRVLSNNFVSVDGTPADCVHLAINGYLSQQPDMVISGINLGANLGDDVLYSGTVAAAIEGRFLGKPAIAVSLVGGREDSDYAPAAEITRRLVTYWEEVPLPRRTLLNVNVPNLPLAEIKGILVTRQGHRQQSQDVLKFTDPRGREGFWLGVAGDFEDAGEGTDFHAVENGYVSVTPIQADMTCHEILNNMSQWSKDIL